MSYAYILERERLFTEEGARILLGVRTKVQRLLHEAGAVRSQEAMSGITGDVWLMLAALDYLVEAGEIREVTDSTVWGQHRVFVAGHNARGC